LLEPNETGQLLDAIEDEVKEGGYIIDWHACDLFPKSWIDLVVVLRVKSETLYDRLKERFVFENPQSTSIC
jgi:adenylate kinase